MRDNPPLAGKSGLVGNDAMVAMNEALILGSVRQHEFTEAAESLNAELKVEIAERKRAEENLRDSEIRYRRLFETASDGILLVELESATITDANPQMSQLLGRTRDQFVGKPLWDIDLFGNPAAIRQLLMRLETTLEIRFEELPLYHCDGHLWVVEVVANLYRETSHSVVQFNIRDITERKNAETTQRRFDALAASNVELNRQIDLRKATEAALQLTQQEQIHLLEQSRIQEEHLRDMSRRILHAQEDERKRISRELHDVISQNLIGINVSIAALANGDPAAPRDFRRKIAKTQRIVEESVNRVHHFARELRPALLDDLGLIPTLHSHLKWFMKETGIRSTLSVFAGIEQADGDVLTTFYRIAQEALANVARHAQADQVAVSIFTREGIVVMEITDDGIGFQGTANSPPVKEGRLGLLGMKERIEMVGGCFHIESLPGQGTTVRVAISNLSPSTP
jgi:PAS domain S-box-containing protein